MFTKEYSISNISYIFGNKIEKGSISIKQNIISGFSKQKFDYKLDKSLVIPAFINTYDNLLETYYPIINNDKEIKLKESSSEKNKLDNNSIYLLGAYKNFISGVLTVFDCDAENNAYTSTSIDNMPIRIFNNSNSYNKVLSSLKIYNKYNPEHLDNVVQADNIPSESILIDAKILSDKDIDNRAKLKSNLIWSPSSSYFISNKRNNIKKCIESGINVSLASLSTTAGECAFLDEMHFAQNYYKKTYHEKLNEKILYNMVSKNAAKCLQVPILGEINKDNIADLLVIKNNNKNPYITISKLTLNDIEAIIQEGIFVYANEKYAEMVYRNNSKVYTFNVQGHKRYSLYDIKGFIEKIRNILGYIKEFPFLPID